MSSSGPPPVDRPNAPKARPMSVWTLTQVQAFTASRLPDLRVLATQPFTGGFWNDVQRLETSAGDLVLKRYRPVLPGSLFPNLPQHEALALTRLAGLDVAPELVGFWPADQVLIYRHVPGPEWQDDVVAAARLMRRQTGANAQGFRAVPVFAREILAQADDFLAACAPDDMTRALLASRPAPLPSPPAPLCLIHTDPAAANLVGQGAGLRLIDWQCPALGDLAEDVSVLLSPAFRVLYDRPQITPDQRQRFLTTLDDPALTARLPALEPAYAWRLATYCARRAQTAADPALSLRYRSAALTQAKALQDLARHP